MKRTKLIVLPWYYRMIFYGFHGFADEIVFTAIYDLVSGTSDRRLMGHTSLYSFFVYGLCALWVEPLYHRLSGGSEMVSDICTESGYYKFRQMKPVSPLYKTWNWPRWGRVGVYIFICYSWEFCCGLLLSIFEACPWNYRHYRYNFMGLITLEYLPGWLFLCYWQDCVYQFIFSLRIMTEAIKAEQFPITNNRIERQAQNDRAMKKLI